ncbi:MAG TPA: nicotinamide-nucleotide amidohydrolase family protein [Stellaceae bacterium]|nr:nicotinamide-nucleotide amidohydrolase family protein [Stellaceae bacterium]
MPADDLAARVLDACRARGWRLGTAESCTGGLVAGALTEIAGASDVVEAGLVTYSNAAKTRFLGVPAELIQAVGAVSEEVARAMAEGVLRVLPEAHLAVSVTGIAGPGGATPGKPVGLVHFGLAVRDAETRHRREVFVGDRSAVRRSSVLCALEMLLAACE